jgi:hypothetical protein
MKGGWVSVADVILSLEMHGHFEQGRKKIVFYRDYNVPTFFSKSIKRCYDMQEV